MPSPIPGVRGAFTITCSPLLPYLIRKAAMKVGADNSTVYLREVVTRAVCEELGEDFDAIMATHPPSRTTKQFLFGTGQWARPNPHYVDDGS